MITQLNLVRVIASSDEHLNNIYVMEFTPGGDTNETRGRG